MRCAITVTGLDETILPLDHRRAGQITDDDINEMVVRPIVQGCRLHAVIDACHSGSGVQTKKQIVQLHPP